MHPPTILDNRSRSKRKKREWEECDKGHLASQYIVTYTDGSKDEKEKVGIGMYIKVCREKDA